MLLEVEKHDKNSAIRILNNNTFTTTVSQALICDQIQSDYNVFQIIPASKLAAMAKPRSSHWVTNSSLNSPLHIKGS